MIVSTADLILLFQIKINLNLLNRKKDKKICAIFFERSPNLINLTCCNKLYKRVKMLK